MQFRPLLTLLLVFTSGQLLAQPVPDRVMLTLRTAVFSAALTGFAKVSGFSRVIPVDGLTAGTYILGIGESSGRLLTS